MNPLRTIARDLFERRLWPVAALLAALLVAIPVLLLRPSPAALESATPAPAAAAAPTGATGAATGTTGAVAPTNVLADPNVVLTSSPFASAFGAGLDLPPSMEGLLKAGKGPDERKNVAGSPLHDPFASTATATASSAGAGSAETTNESPSIGEVPAAPSGGSSAPASSAPADSGTTGPSDAVADAPPVTNDPPATVEPNAPADDMTVYHADVRFGTVAASPMVKGAARLTAFPSSYSPLAVYLGVMRGGWGAAFALRDGTQPVGSPACRPRKQICSWVILHPGESVTVTTKDETTGAVTPYTLKLERIRATTLSPEAAEIANGRVSTAGRCLLGPLAAYRYDTTSGTLAPRPELQACKYRAPGQAEGASVRSVHIG